MRRDQFLHEEDSILKALSTFYEATLQWSFNLIYCHIPQRATYGHRHDDLIHIRPAINTLTISPYQNQNTRIWKQSSRGQHGAHLGPVGPRWAPYWPHEPCYQGTPSSVSSHRNPVEDRVTVDEIYGYPILKWHPVTWLKDRTPEEYFQRCPPGDMIRYMRRQSYDILCCFSYLVVIAN